MSFLGTHWPVIPGSSFFFPFPVSGNYTILQRLVKHDGSWPSDLTWWSPQPPQMRFIRLHELVLHTGAP